MRTTALLFVVSLCSSLMHAQVWLDPTFGTGGAVISSLSPSFDGALCLALQPDGRIVVAGAFAQSGSESDFLVARYLANGDLDVSFGTNGYTTYDVASGDVANDVALQSDGSIVVVGTANGAGSDKVIMRFTATGQLDASFNGTGALVIDDSFVEDQLNGVAIQPDGKILAVGQGFNNSKDTFYICRLNSDGTFDSTFGTGGQIEHAILSDNCRALDVVIMDDGRIVSVGGSYVDAGTNFQAAVTRYMPDGTFDATFNGDGRTVIDWSFINDMAYAVQVQLDGKVLLGGAESENGPNSRIVASRLLENGSLDMAFGTAGTFRSFTGAGGTRCSAIAIDAGGRILIGGSAATGSNFRQSYVCRLLSSNGQLDSGFGTSGELFHGLPGSTEDTPALAVQSDGKILLAGTAYDFPSSDLMLLRYLETPLTGISDGTTGQIRSVHADGTGALVFGAGSTDALYEVTDARGGLIASGRMLGSASGSQRIDFHTVLVPGTYMLTFRSGIGRSTTRFTVTH